ncbi:hypothetical protein AB0C69_41150, partial [Actinomadura sp. NPDC048032]
GRRRGPPGGRHVVGHRHRPDVPPGHVRGPVGGRPRYDDWEPERKSKAPIFGAIAAIAVLALVVGLFMAARSGSDSKETPPTPTVTDSGPVSEEPTTEQPEEPTPTRTRTRQNTPPPRTSEPTQEQPTTEVPTDPPTTDTPPSTPTSPGGGTGGTGGTGGPGTGGGDGGTGTGAGGTGTGGG